MAMWFFLDISNYWIESGSAHLVLSYYYASFIHISGGPCVDEIGLFLLDNEYVLRCSSNVMAA